MTSINPQSIEKKTITPNDPIAPVTPVDAVEASESDRFSQLLKKDSEQDSLKPTKNSEDELTLEELHQSFRDSTFRAGFNRMLEKAKEMVKEMKE